MGHGRYILQDREPVECEDLHEWGAWISKVENKRVLSTEIGDVRVSTVFLGLDHSFGEGAPVLFETMIFGGEHDQYQDRYCSYDEAEKGHQEAINLVLKA